MRAARQVPATSLPDLHDPWPGEGGRPDGQTATTAAPAPEPDTSPVAGGIPPLNTAEGEPPASAATPFSTRPAVHLVRIDEPPAIDGRIDDAAWQSAPTITRFVQRDPFEGSPATEATEVWVTFDKDALYVAVHAHYSDTSLIRANRADRDQIGGDDRVLLFFDPFLDHQRSYVFSVNAFGVQGDSLMSPGRGGGGPGGPGDSSWDALYESAGRLVHDGWTAEMAIPFKSLRYPARGPGEVHQWGFQVQREIQSKNETVVWSPVSRDVMGFLNQMGTLDGLTDLSRSRNLEILPTFTAIRASAVNEANGRYETVASRPDAGVNLKYGLTSNLTLDFTANPDFSQIESDEAQIEVNQRFPVFYPERRPFFLEGQEIFSVQGPVNLLHTRTIVDPRLGAKLTGKQGRSSIGVLVVDDEAAGLVEDPASAAFGQSASVFAARARFDLYPESYVGAIVTSREFSDTHSRVAGVDGQFRLGRSHRLGLRLIASDRLDGNGARLTGPMFDIGFRRESRNLFYGASYFEIDPEFGTALGFVRRVNTREANVNVGYRWWPGTSLLTWGPRVSYSRNHNYAGVLEDEELNTEFNFDFAQNFQIDGGVRTSMERYGGIAFDKTRYSFGGRSNSSRRISFRGEVSLGDQIRYVVDPFLGRARNLNASMTLRPASRLRTRIDLDTSRLGDPRDGSEVYTVKILRAQTNYQFSDRLMVRNITDFNSYDETVGLNVLFTYRINSGTAFFAGYDDRYQQAETIENYAQPGTGYQPTNRAVFMKLQYLFRY